MDIFDLQAKISLDVQEYIDGLDGAEKKTSNFGSKLKTGLATAGKIGAAAVGAATVAAGAFTKAVIGGTKEVANYGDEVDKMSQKLGLSASAYQEWDYVLGQAGVEITSMSTGLKTLTNQIDEAKNGSEDATKRFESLGISLEDLSTMSREDVFAAVVEGFQGMADSTERAALANDLFGKSGQELTPLFNASIEETKELRDAAHDLGFVLSDETVKASADYKDALDTMQRTISGVKNKLSAEFLPSLTSVMDGMTKLFAGNTDEGIGLIKSGLDEFVGKMTETVPKVLSVGSEIVLALSSAIIENMDSIVGTGFDIVIQLGNGIIKNLPKLAKSAVEIIKTLAKNISKNIKPLLQAFVSAITEIAKELTNPSTLSDLVDAALEMILALADGLIEAVPQLIKAIPQIIKNLVNALVRNTSKIASAGVELFKGLVSGLDEAGVEIIKAIPSLIASIAKGLIQGTSQIIKGTFMALFGIEDGAAQAAEGIREHVEAIESYRQRISELTPTIGDFNKMLSDSGKTIPQIDEEIAETEEKITAIISRALSENRELRAGEIEAIKKYNEDIRALEEERLSIYYDTQIGTLKKIQLEAGQITAETAEQYKVDAQAARDAAIETTEQFYTDQLARIENGNKAGQYANDEAYQRALDAAKQDRDERIAVTEGMYADSLAVISESSDKWVQVDSEKWAKLSDQMERFSVNSDSWFSNFINSANDWVGNYDGAKTRYLEMLNEMDFENTNAFLNMQAQVKASGKEIPNESKEMVNNILKSFENLPEGMDDAGKDALLGLIDGMEDQIPGLNNASSMSADEIVKTLRKELGIHSPSTVLKEVGENAALGIVKGIEGKKRNITTLMGEIATAIKDSVKSLPSAMQTAGENIARGIWTGINSQRGQLLRNVSNLMSDIVGTVNDKMKISSPSRVMAEAGQYMAQGIGVGWQNAFDDVRGDISDSLHFDVPSMGGNGNAGALTVIVGLLESILDNMGYDVVLDSGALIGTVDRGLGTESLRKARGN